MSGNTMLRLDIEEIVNIIMGTTVSPLIEEDTDMESLVCNISFANTDEDINH